MRKSTLTILAASAAVAAVLSGCSEAASGTSSGGGGGDATTAASIDASIGTQFSGGKPGSPATGTPIKIGVINQEGGQVSDPEVSAAIKAAFDYINAEQGGIGGHPLSMDLCKITSSEEEAQQCAQRFLNDSSIQVVLQGGLNTGAQAVHQTLNGAKPDVISLANPGPDATAANAFAVNPSVIAAIPGTVAYAKSQGYKSAAIVSSDNPGNVAIAQILKGVLTGAGVEATLTTFADGSTDLTSAYTAALRTNPSAVLPIAVTTAACTATAKALSQIGSSTPVLSASLCATDDVKKNLGGDLPAWAYESTVLSLFAPDSTGQVAFYKAVMAKYAPDASTGTGAPAAFGAAFLLAKALNTAGADSITSDSVSKALKAYTGGVLLGTPKVGFGSVKDSPALSGTADRYYIYKGNNNWTVTDWQNLPN